MAFDSAKLQELFKDKRVLIGAAVIGGVAGLYVLSKSGGMGGAGGAGLQPDTPLQPNQPGTGSDGGDGGAGLQGQIAELTANQSSFQAQVQAALAAIQDSFSNALGGAQSQNASALQSVIDQVNSRLSEGAYQQSTVPDFAGFQSQLLSALGAQQYAPTAQTGNILSNVAMKSLSGRTRLTQQTATDWLNKVRPPNTYTKVAPTPAPNIKRLSGVLTSSFNRLSSGGFLSALGTPQFSGTNLSSPARALNNYRPGMFGTFNVPQPIKRITKTPTRLPTYNIRRTPQR